MVPSEPIEREAQLPTDCRNLTPTMRILWLNWKDLSHPEAGGAETFTHEVARRLVARRHTVTLLTSSHPGAEPESVLDGVRIVRRGTKQSVFKYAKTFYNQSEFDVVIDEINTRPFMAPKFADKKTFALIHQLAREYWWYEVPTPLGILGYFVLERMWLRVYTRIPTITVSLSTAEDLKRIGFQRVFVVPEGISYVPLRDLAPKESVPTVLYVGRVNKAKRPDHLR